MKEETKLTPEEIKLQARKDRAKELGARYVVGIVDDNKFLFLKEPDKAVYKAFGDLYQQDVTTAKETALRMIVIKEISDMEIFEDYKSLLSVFEDLADVMALKKSTLEIL